MGKKPIFYVPLMILFLGVSYAIFFLFDQQTLLKLGEEDGLFENLTAVFFFLTAVFFFLMFIKSKSGNDFFLFRTKKNFILLFFCLSFIFGCGEEISWGQRIFHFKTPDSLEKINVQKETNIHNIRFFSTWDFGHQQKSGLSRYLTISGLFVLLWFAYGVLLPLLDKFIPWIASLLKRINIPIVPLWFSLFFMLNWVGYRIMSSVLREDVLLQFSLGEIKECNIAFLFMLAGLYFLFNCGQPVTEPRSSPKNWG